MRSIVGFFRKDNIGEPPWEYDFLYNLPEKEYPKYLEKIFNYRTGEKLPLCFDFYKKAWIIDKKRCKTFNQKIQWIKLNFRRVESPNSILEARTRSNKKSAETHKGVNGIIDTFESGSKDFNEENSEYYNLVRKCTDKVAVRDYVRERIGEEYLKPALQVIPNKEQQFTDVIASKSASIEDLRGNPLNKSNNVDCHGSQNAVEPRNDMRSVESIRLSVIANVTTSNTGNVWQSGKNAELDEIATAPKTPSFHINDMEQKFRDCHGSQNAVEPRNDGKFDLLQSNLNDVSRYFDQINWEKLPQAFVIKCNHGCKWQYIIKNKEQFLNIPKLVDIVKKQITGWLEQDYSIWGGFEMQYRGIEPKIIIEELLREDINKNSENIHVYCFNGLPKFIIKLHNKNEITVYDEKLNVMEDVFEFEEKNVNIFSDDNINQTFVLSKQLAKDFNIVRVDWMIYQNQLYFEELTFTPYSGFHKFKSSKNNLKIGKLIDLERE